MEYCGHDRAANKNNKRKMLAVQKISIIFQMILLFQKLFRASLKIT
jgi:hypothetical protein